MNKHIYNPDKSVPEEILRISHLDKDTKSLFKVPDAYFESLPSRIQDKMSTRNSQWFSVDWVLRLVVSRLFWIPALSALVLITLGILFLPETSKPKLMVGNQDSLNLNLAYDGSYAGDVLFEELSEIYYMLDSSEPGDFASDYTSYTMVDEVTEDDIIDFLQEQELDSEVLAEL